MGQTIYPKWYYDELKQVGTDYGSIEEIKNYDSKMSSIRNVKKEVEEIVSKIGLSRDQTLLEIGTATGEFAIEASKHCYKVYAIDISSLMLEYAREKAKSRNRENVIFRHGGFLTYEHIGEPVDAIVTEIALHHLPDFWKFIALKRMSDMLRNGGKLYIKDVVFSFHIDEYENYFNNRLQREIDAGNIKIANDTALHIKEEFSTIDWIMEGLIERAGFTINKKEYIDGFLGSYVCLKKCQVIAEKLLRPQPDKEEKNGLNKPLFTSIHDNPTATTVVIPPACG